MSGSLFPRRCLGLALLAMLIIALGVQGSGSVVSSVLATYTFSGTVYVGLDAPVGLPGVSLALWGSSSDTSLGTQLDTTVSFSGRPLGSYSLSTMSGTVYRFYHIVLTPLPGYEPLRAVPGAGGAGVSATWIRFGPASAGEHPGNLFYLSATGTPTATTVPTSTPTRVPTSTSTHVPTSTSTHVPTSTSTHVPTSTSTPTRTSTRTSTPTATRTATATPTRTSTPTAAGVQVLDLCAMADTTLAEAGANSNYGDATGLAVGYSPANGPRRRSLLRFVWPTLPAGAVVQSATLRLQLVAAAGDASSTVSVYALAADWQEMTVTWGNQPAVYTGAFAQANVGSAAPAQVSWDVTTLVQQWADGTRPNFGLELRGNESGNWLRGLDSREAPGGVCPRLIVTVKSGVPIATFTPSRTPTRTPTATRTPTVTPTVQCEPEVGVGSSFADAANFAALNLNEFVHEYICPSSDEDWYKFPVLAGQYISIVLYDLPNDYMLYLYRPDGSYVDSSGFPGYDERIERTADQSGDWRVAVRSRTGESWSSTVTYALAGSVCAGPDEGDEQHPGTLSLGNVQQALICPCTDEDWFTVDIPRAQAVYVVAWMASENPDYDLYLYGPDGWARGAATKPGAIDKTVRVPADNTPGLWRVKITPREGSDCNTTAYYHVQVRLETDLDLTVSGIEVTQVIQNDTGPYVDLVLGKPTVARVYVDIGAAAGPIEDVVVELSAFADCLNCTPLPGSPVSLGPQTVTKMSTQAQRLSLAGFTVPLPAAWQNAGMLYVLARVYSLNPRQSETNPYNNTNYENYRYITRAPVNLVIVPVTAGGLTPAFKNNPQLDNVVSFMRDSYPTSIIQLWVPGTGQGIVADYDYTIKGSSGCGMSWNKLLWDLFFSTINISGPPPGFLVYGILDASTPKYWAGCGSYTTRVAAGILNTGANNLAHEAGHMLGLPHAPCGGSVYPEDVDPQFPTYPDPLGGKFPAASIGKVGVRLNGAMTVLDPAKTKDMMSYCAPSWFSPYNYVKLMGAIPAAAVQAQASPAQSPHLIAAGEVNSGQIQLPYPLAIESLPESPAQAGTGDYRVEVQDARGAVLASRAFDPRDPYHGGSADDGLFAEVLPYPAGAARVVFSRQGVVQHTITPSAHAPTVTITYPRGGEVWSASGTYTLTWQVSDADGDAVHSTLLYSRNNGSTWNPVAVNLTGVSYPVDAALLAGGDQALFRVLATDGLLTTSADTAAPVRVPNKPPLVMLLGPVEGSVSAPGQSVFLQSLATDMEDGPLSPESLSWSSDRDGPLGAGGDLAVSTLSAGWHNLTVAASDSAGARGAASVRVLVGRRIWLPLALKKG